VRHGNDPRLLTVLELVMRPRREPRARRRSLQVNRGLTRDATRSENRNVCGQRPWRSQSSVEINAAEAPRRPTTSQRWTNHKALLKSTQLKRVLNNCDKCGLGRVACPLTLRDLEALDHQELRPRGLQRQCARLLKARHAPTLPRAPILTRSAVGGLRAGSRSAGPRARPCEALARFGVAEAGEQVWQPDQLTTERSHGLGDK
jgi:hypothetical protein